MTHHVDIWVNSKGLKIFKGLGDPYVYGKYTPVVPIIMELDYKGIKVRSWAVLHPNPHPEMCIWLLNSDGDKRGGFGPRRTSYGRDNAEVEKAPSVFIPPADPWLVVAEE